MSVKYGVKWKYICPIIITYLHCVSGRSPPESTVIDPLSRPFSTRSTRSHSHVPTSPLSLGPLTVTTPAARQPRSFSTSALDAHTYNHLRDHEGMEPIPLDYPLNEYSKLGPRSETPPLRPPKPPHIQQKGAIADDPLSNFEPPVLATTNPATVSERSPAVGAGNHVSRDSEQGGERDIGSQREEGRGEGIYDTMTTEGLRIQPGTAQGALGESTANLDTRDYDNLALGEAALPPSTTITATTTTVTASPSPVSGSRKQRKSSVKIFDDPTYSPPPEKPGPNGSRGGSSRIGNGVASRHGRSASVKVIDPRYAGDYERHPEFTPPQIEIPRDQLQQKYRGDYERDPTYFSRNPTRSFSVSAASSAAVSQGRGGGRERRSSLTLEPPVADKYRGDYERSEDYIPPPQRQVWNEDTRTEDYVLEPDPSYAGEYERHPNYVPPLIKRSSKTKMQILSTDTVSNGVSSDRPNHMPHEYTSLAAVTKDPPRHYATLNPDLSTICTFPTGSLKDSMV